MGKTVDTIMTEALRLSPEARAFLAEKLIESLDMPRDADLSPQWQQAIARRCREIDTNEVKLHEAQEVFREAFSLLE